MLSRVSKSAIEMNSTIGEQYVELCQTALRLALKHGRVDSMEMWLQKISDAFGIFHKYNSLYEDCKRIHFGLLHVLAIQDDTKTYQAVSDLSKASVAFTTLAKELCREIEKGHPKHPSVLLFQLEYMSNEEQPDSASFHRGKDVVQHGYNSLMLTCQRLWDTLQLWNLPFAISKGITITPSLNITLTEKIFAIHPQTARLKGIDHNSSNQALEALENLLAMISSFSDNTKWLEQIFVVLLRLFTSTPWSSIEYTKFLETVANIFSDALPNSLENAASDASLIIIWKQVESYALQKNFLHAQAWCSLGRHDLFQHASMVNRSRILRKGMFCAFQVVDFVDVERAWTLLPEHDRDSETAYLMYQVYLKEKKTSSAAHLLKWIDDMGNEGPHYTVAAIAAAICLHERKQALQITQTLIDEGLDTYKNGRFSFDLFRIAIQIIIIEFRENQKHVENLISQIYEIFSKVFDILQKQIFELTDLDWFARCSYLIALEMFKEAGHSHTLLLLGISLRFTNLYPETIGSDVKSNLEHHRLSCLYLQTLLHAAKARTETNSSRKESSYSEVIRHFQATQTILDAQNIKHENTWPADRYRQLLVFKVEATTFLSATMDVEPSIPS
ncbi:hypothetical protein BGW36DRAFT_403228 [Talaromyces proteolyticus]|uniref:Protein ZIP4 homolog n=1 Tax=Talaromyces proteolyticus TaxID=1131652 RepID=A0AAD4Q6H1_9EURO|nr:uncharacterized protein BGW36DRAFT_403228 [Talaromyces proteolyticus]KAH8705701.1 hypothetical protein BGW36DRAFT_403228 [Talaromyces proteolyticus]